MLNPKQRLNGSNVATDCKNCPYPSTGFLCGGNDGECMKTRVQKIKNTSKMRIASMIKTVLINVAGSQYSVVKYQYSV